ncbi:MAG: pilus assembly protein PilM [Planctomycetes bacterium]|nr:pilus assembly protein PilM [Planctomycetota bacterium]
MAHSTVWGVDIGNSAIKAIKMVKSGGESRIVDFDIIDIQASDDDSDRNTRVQSALGTLCSNHSFGHDAVFLSLPGNLCLFREFTLPPGSESKLEDLIMYEAKQQIPFPLDQVEMAWERYDDPSGVGVEMIVVRKNIVQEILSLTDQFKLNVRGISVSPVALFNFIHHEFQPQGTTLILDAGYKGTDFVVMQGRHMYSRTIQIAGREITRVLENKFKVPYERAEGLKKNINQSKQADKILSVIEPTLRQLGAEIQRTIGFYKSKARGQKINHAYLLGHTFRLPRMAESLATQVREAPFTVVEGMKRIQLGPQVNPEVFANEFPTMAVAIGLGLQGIGLSDFTVNLLPQERKTEISLQSKRKWAVLAAVAVVVAVAINYFQSSSQIAALQDLKTASENALKEVNEKANEIKSKSAPLDQLEFRVNKLIRIARDRGRILEIFQQIANLKNTDGRPFFGKDSGFPDGNKVYLTNLYVSRYPFGSNDLTKLPARSAEFTNNRDGRLQNSKNLVGSSSIYTPSARLYLGAEYFDPSGRLKSNKDAEGKRLLAAIADPKTLKTKFEAKDRPMPDAPMVVIVSGEIEGDTFRGRDILDQLRKALLASPGIVDVRADDYQSEMRHVELQPNLDKAGNLVKGEPVFGARLTKEYTAFHVVCRYLPDGKLDPDFGLNGQPLVVANQQ